MVSDQTQKEKRTKKKKKLFAFFRLHTEAIKVFYMFSAISSKYDCRR